MNHPEFDTILDDCVARLRQGETVETCLADFPNQVNDLAPLLTLSADLLSLPPLTANPAAIQQGREATLAALDAGNNGDRVAIWHRLIQNWRRIVQTGGHGMRPVLRGAIALLLLVFLGSFVVGASADSLPGDTLFPVKRAWEKTRLTLTLNPSNRQAFQSELEERRRQEVQAVQALGRPVMVEFNGRLQALAGDRWVVAGMTVQASSGTIVQGPAVVGQQVHMQVQVLEDGTLLALMVTAAEDSQPETAVPTDAPTQTPVPTVTTEPSATPTSTKTARPTEAAHEPTPTHPPTRILTPTHAPTHEPAPTHLPTHEPTPTHPPIDEPTPTHPPAHEPTHPPEPTREPHPTDEPVRDEPEPTPEPHPTDAPVHEPTPTHPPDRVPTHPPPTHEPTPEPTTGRDEPPGHDAEPTHTPEHPP